MNGETKVYRQMREHLSVTCTFSKGPHRNTFWNCFLFKDDKDT